MSLYPNLLDKYQLEKVNWLDLRQKPIDGGDVGDLAKSLAFSYDRRLIELNKNGCNSKRKKYNCRCPTCEWHVIFRRRKPSGPWYYDTSSTQHSPECDAALNPSLTHCEILRNLLEFRSFLAYCLARSIDFEIEAAQNFLLKHGIDIREMEESSYYKAKSNALSLLRKASISEIPSEIDCDHVKNLAHDVTDAASPPPANTDCDSDTDRTVDSSVDTFSAGSSYCQAESDLDGVLNTFTETNFSTFACCGNDHDRTAYGSNCSSNQDKDSEESEKRDMHSKNPDVDSNNKSNAKSDADLDYTSEQGGNKDPGKNRGDALAPGHNTTVYDSSFDTSSKGNASGDFWDHSGGHNSALSAQQNENDLSTEREGVTVATAFENLMDIESSCQDQNMLLSLNLKIDLALQSPARSSPITAGESVVQESGTNLQCSNKTPKHNRSSKPCSKRGRHWVDITWEPDSSLPSSKSSFTAPAVSKERKAGELPLTTRTSKKSKHSGTYQENIFVPTQQPQTKEDSFEESDASSLASFISNDDGADCTLEGKITQKWESDESGLRKEVTDKNSNNGGAGSRKGCDNGLATDVGGGALYQAHTDYNDQTCIGKGSDEWGNRSNSSGVSSDHRRHTGSSTMSCSTNYYPTLKDDSTHAIIVRDCKSIQRAETIHPVSKIIITVNVISKHSY